MSDNHHQQQQHYAENLNNLVQNKSSAMADNKLSDVGLLAQKIEEMTVEQMKKMEVQKLEDSFTIKELERTHAENARILSFTRDSYNEYQKHSQQQLEQIRNVNHGLADLVNKYMELKNFQDRVIKFRITVSDQDHEKISVIKNELKQAFNIMMKKKESFSQLQANIESSKKRANLDVSIKIEEMQKTLSAEIENKNKLTKMMDLAIEQSSECQAEFEKFVQTENDMDIKICELEKQEKAHLLELEEIKKSQQEVEELKNKIIILRQRSEEYRIELQKLDLELNELKSEISILNKNLTSKTSQYAEQLNEISKKREISNLLKTSYEENYCNLKTELEEAEDEMKKENSDFAAEEDALQKELSELYKQQEDEKSSLKQFNVMQIELSKLREMKKFKENEMSSYTRQNSERYKKLLEEQNKCEKSLGVFKKKLYDLRSNIAEFEVKRVDLLRKIESVNRTNSKELDVACLLENDLLYKQKPSTAQLDKVSASNNNFNTSNNYNDQDDNSLSSQLFDELLSQSSTVDQDTKKNSFKRPQGLTRSSKKKLFK